MSISNITKGQYHTVHEVLGLSMLWGEPMVEPSLILAVSFSLPEVSQMMSVSNTTSGAGQL